VEREIGAQTIERAIRPFLHRIHRARDEAAALVHLAVVDPVGRLVGFRVHDQLALAGLEIEKVEPVGERRRPKVKGVGCARSGRSCSAEKLAPVRERVSPQMLLGGPALGCSAHIEPLRVVLA
jgi:hypothetical protein